jgi:hypothetical protein
VCPLPPILSLLPTSSTSRRRSLAGQPAPPLPPYLTACGRMDVVTPQDFGPRRHPRALCQHEGAVEAPSADGRHATGPPRDLGPHRPCWQARHALPYSLRRHG